MNLIEQGIANKLIKFDSEERNTVTYLNQKKSRNYNNPEEQVQAETFCSLVLEYGYPVKRVKNFVSVTRGSGKLEVDIIVYNDDKCLQPHIVVECKKEDVSEAEFRQAIEQGFSYAQTIASEVKYVWTTSKIKNAYFRFDKSKDTREPESDIPAYGVNKLAAYKYVKDAGSMIFKEGEQRFFDIDVVEQSELTRRFKLAHNALWAGGQLNPSEAFDELDKLIFCKIWDERKARKVGTPYDFQIIQEEASNPKDALAKTNEMLFKRIESLYNEGKKEDPEVFKDNIRLTNERVRTIVEYLQDINLSETDLDSKGRAFETFMDSFFRGSFGQYFTPREIVKFIVDVLPITSKSKVLDTSCGSGGFLLHALEKVRRAATEIYPNYKTDPKKYLSWHKYWHDFAEKKLYGIEINEQISRAAKMNMIIHDDGHTNVITADGLLSDTALKQSSKNDKFEYGTFDFIITNPPFGSAVRLTEQAYLKNYNLGQKDTSWLDLKNTGVKNRDTQSTEVLFIEQCYQFLNEGGYLAVVIPDGILTNSSLQYVRDNIEEWFRIVAVISLPSTAFTATGAGVKSSVLFLKKYPKKITLKLQEQKKDIQAKILHKYSYEKQIGEWDKERKNILSNAVGISFDGDLKEFKKTELYKEWKKEKSAEFTEKLNDLKSQLEDIYIQKKQSELPDYSIFMAIAEDIGYDAVGKNTGNNELDIITESLVQFISEVE
ncbi:restriction endonuclease subunit M [Pseudoalteromonas fuliginea]|uniref:restriction endonuclease subunit M n=1 Tax=Pseudoalteromonas fuliginea TaxID=1872678 RepID=UPI0031742C45